MNHALTARNMTAIRGGNGPQPSVLERTVIFLRGNVAIVSTALVVPALKPNDLSHLYKAK